MSHKATIADIARALNTTPATVSRALRNHPGISEKTKQLVWQTASRLNYKRNRIASSLRSGKTHLIGVIIPSAEINFFGSVVHGIESVANMYGYNVLLYQSNESPDYEQRALETFMSTRVDGILVSLAKGTKDLAHFEEIKARNIPMVFFDRTHQEFGFDSVVVDDYRGAYQATTHLVQQGYQRIAHIAGPQHLKNFRDRLNGYNDALVHQGLCPDPSLTFLGNVSIESGREGMRHFLSHTRPPDAVFATEDFTALGVIKEAKESGIDVPGKLGVIGFANELFGLHITPTLSTVDQQTILMGKTALNLLLGTINQKTARKQQSVVLEPQLICRGSSDRMNRLYPAIV